MQIPDTETHPSSTIDAGQLIQRLRNLDLEEGRRLIIQYAADPWNTATFGVALADEALKELYMPFLSLKLAELLVFFGDYARHPSSHALGLKAKGDALVQIGHFQAAIESLDAAGEEFLRMGDEGNWARSRISWITASESLGRVEEALQEAERARSAFERLDEHYWACNIAINTAVVFDHLGRYQDAIRLYEYVRSICPTLIDQHEVDIRRIIAITELDQAISLSWLGRFSEASHLQQKAHDSFLALGEMGLVVFIEIDMANLAYTQGYYGQALQLYLHVRDMLLQDGDDSPTNPMQLAELKLWMASCLAKLNRVQEACQLVEEAVVTYKQTGTSLQTSNALREYARALQASGRLQEALTVLQEALTLFHRGGFDLYISATKLQEAEILLEMGDLSQAYELAQQIRVQFEAQHFVARSIRASLIIVQILFRKANQAEEPDGRNPVQLLEEARYLAKQIVLQAKRYNLQEERYKSHFYLGQIFAFQGNTAKATKHYRAAIIQIERILNNLAFDLSPSFLRAAWRVYEEMIALCIRQFQPEHAFCYLERVRSVALHQYLNSTNILQEKAREETTDTSLLQENRARRLHLQYELREWQEKYHYYSALLANVNSSASPSVDQGIIQAEIQRCESRVNELFERLQLAQLETPSMAHVQGKKELTFEQHNIEQLRQHLSPNQLLLAYFLFKDTLTIFAMTAECLRTVEAPSGRKELERLLPFLHAHLHPGSWPDVQKPPQQAIRRLLRKLYDLLISPVKTLLPPEQGQLTIVPYGPLHTLPFHALYDGSHFLIEDFQVHYLPASNLLLHYSEYHKEAKVSNETNTSLDTGTPLVFGYSGSGHLQRCVDEAETLAYMLRGRCYQEKEATIARLIEQAPGSPIIHIATHGRARLDAPNFSSVLLADGQLNAIDAFSLDLQGCELVTLSGCETGLALSGGGDEQSGLGRAFLAAGARSLVISLWPVEDRSTNELMQAFYQGLLQGENKMQALRAAQCSLLHSDSPLLSHPYFWAAFRLLGDPAPMSLYQNSSECTKFTL
ncbi:MAG: CHAT domain-containing protein [Ktedonobacteraceae bacterium]|nr:CHAT domain-containing protein [Ktedonobacteraceae bacterium]